MLLRDSILGAVWWVNGATGPFLRDATQKEHKILRHSLVWPAGGRPDRSAGQWHCSLNSSQKENVLGQEHNSFPWLQAAGAEGQWQGARTAEQLCQGTLGTGQGGEHPNTGQTKQQKKHHMDWCPWGWGPGMTCSGTDHFLTRNPLSKSEHYNNKKSHRAEGCFCNF